MHQTADNMVKLVPIPLIRASSLPTDLVLGDTTDPNRAIALLEDRQSAELIRFIEYALTGREREVAGVMVRLRDATYKQWLMLPIG